MEVFMAETKYMLKRLTTVFLLGIALTFTGCTSFRNIGSELSAKEGESEIVVNIGTTVYTGRYHIFLDGEHRDVMKKKGGIAKYIVPNGQHVISVDWHGTPGTPTDRDSVQIEANSNRIIVRAIKPSNGVDMLKVELEGIANLHHYV
jgi:hypothetical protein